MDLVPIELYSNAPFAALKKPLAESRVALVTTAAPYQPDAGDQGPWSAYNSKAKFYDVYSGDTSEDHDLRISHIGIDRKHTTAEDVNTWFPLARLKEAQASGRIGELTPRFYGLPTNRSQRVSVEQDCPELLAELQADNADVAILVAS